MPHGPGFETGAALAGKPAGKVGALPLPGDLMSQSDRVRENTSQSVQRRIDRHMEESVRYHAARGDAAIARRLRELDREPDIENRLQLASAFNGLTGIALSLLHDRRWLILSVTTMAFLAQHALQGWCPPLAAFRRLGVRTRKEIERERYALKAMRGDFRALAHGVAEENRRLKATRVLQAVEA
jgi:hypothetical protein